MLNKINLNHYMYKIEFNNLYICYEKIKYTTFISRSSFSLEVFQNLGILQDSEAHP